ncbi:MAG: AAA family ATPase [Planctomycetaceae bacterium]
MLKSLELTGFKSFADRTKFEFSSGITGVVGPNGSGKSNVVDGIKWILGDQSPKSLRGKEMTDVIFNGTRNRKAGALAEATLLFDNTAGFLPVEAAEVQIGRRLWRSGDSEYLLNGQSVRLKDVRQLLMGTGAGSAAYSIIEQGRVDQILQANATSRRGIFEEAAGISLYKTRRAEFVRRMERVDQTLDRLADIVDEVDAQRNALQNQAKKAAAFRELSEELRARWLGLAADDYRVLTAALDDSAQTIERVEAESAELQTARTAAERDLEEVDREIAAVNDRLREKDREVGALRETIAGHLSTIRLQSARAAELDSEFLRLKRQRGRLEERVREGEQELEHIATVLDDSERERRRLEDAAQAHESQLAELAGQLDEEEQYLQSRRDRAAARERRLAELDRRNRDLIAQQEGKRSSLTAARQRSNALDVQRDDEQRRRKTAAEQLAEAAEQLDAARRRHRDVSQRRRELLETQGGHQSALAGLRERRSAAQARLAVLEDLESRQEGIGIGVREILRRAQTSDYAPWNLIGGSVADLIDVDLEHAALLEAALGLRAQLIVIRDFGPLVDYLLAHSSQISGRVGFLEYAPSDARDDAGPPSRRLQLTLPFRPQVERLHAEVLPVSEPFDLTGRPGVVERAVRLASGRAGFEDLPARVLSDTWIVETLEAARILAADFPGACRFVTLQGELLESDGTLTVGTLRAQTAVVSRKSELRCVKNELLRLEREAETEERRLIEADSQIAAVDAEVQIAADEIPECSTTHADCKSQHAACERELRRLDAERAGLRAEIDSLQSALKSLEGKLAAADAERQQLATVLSTERDDLKTLADDIGERQRRLELCRSARDAEQLKLVKQQERSQALCDAHERARREHRVRIQQRDEAGRRLVAATRQRRDVDLAVLQTRAQLAELSLLRQQRLLESDAIAAEKDDIRGRRSELARREATLRNEAAQLQERAHAAEMAARESRQSRDALVDRIEEEFQTDLAEVAGGEISAFGDYLAERREPATDVVNESAEAADPIPDGDETPERDDVSVPPSDDSDNRPNIPVVLLGDEATGLSFEDVREELEAGVDRLRRKVKAMGSVNADSLRDLDEIEQRFEHLSTTLGDLDEAKRHLVDLVRRIDRKCRELFRETFDAIRTNFRELFRRAFGGGDGDVVLEDPDDLLECGIDIIARPPGKELKSITLLSGGEKTLTAFALLLAMFRHNPSPYCVLDEVDAALDESNVDRLRALLEEFKETTQFVIITHKKPTMAIADLLYGVTMEEAGISKRLTVQFENIGENGEFLDDGATGGHSIAA